MGTNTIKSSASELLEQAKIATGIEGISDTQIQERLERLLKSLNTEAPLSERGARAMESRILRLLCNRLRMLRDYQNHPEIDRQEIIRPVIISGAPRTGSTKLHKLLAASGTFKYNRFWQEYNLALRTGNRDEDPADRIDEAREHIEWFNSATPGAKRIHQYMTFEPEEETFLLEHILCEKTLFAFAMIPEYIAWSVCQDFREKMRFIKQALKYLQWQFYPGDNRPWVLKCPIYNGYESEIADVFPDATFVVTHRHPKSILTSSASLLHHFHKAYSDVDNSKLFGAMTLEGQEQVLKQHMDGRDANPNLDLIDVSYTELTQDSQSVIDKIYSHANLEVTEQVRQSISQWELENRQHKHGVHNHSPEMYAINSGIIEEKYKDYINRFGHLF